MTATVAEDVDLHIYSFLNGLVMSAALLVFPSQRRVRLRRRDLEPALDFLLPLLDKYELDDLLFIAIDDKTHQMQSVYGSLLVVDCGDQKPYSLIHGAVPGPFPGVSQHEQGFVSFKDATEATVWIVSHEFCHYLKRSKQLSGPNDEESAVAFADEQLLVFKASLP